MTALGNLTRQIGELLARTEAGIAACHEVSDQLIACADEVDKTRTEDMDRQRQMLQKESDPHKLREIERQYVQTAVDRARAKRVARYERDRRAARQAGTVGEPLVRRPVPVPGRKGGRRSMGRK
ncbi:MAG: hypothetical protein U9R79_22865 [Armatimonadota bacterium]|nr:hypothetical protein [Armatimonadota bacterium]